MTATGSALTHPRLHLLGDFEATYDGQPLQITHSGQRLLACLAVLHGRRPVRRVGISDRLWPDAAPGRACATLRSVVWRLPRPRGRALVSSTATTIALHEDVAVDIWDSEQMVTGLDGLTEREPERLVDLAGLDSDLLPGWDEDWLVGEREAFRQARLHALEQVAAAHCDVGRFADALGAGLRAVRSEPLRESAHRLVIEVHIAEGNVAEALRQYHGYRQLLADELGIPPSPAIRRLIDPLLGRSGGSGRRHEGRGRRASRAVPQGGDLVGRGRPGPAGAARSAAPSDAGYLVEHTSSSGVVQHGASTGARSAGES